MTAHAHNPASAWRARVFAGVWCGYAAYYLCRHNLSLAIPAIADEFAFSKTAMGGIAAALPVAYAAGQFFNGQLADRFGGRVLIALGAIASAALCFAFGFAGGVAVIAVLWLANGYFQAMGWPSTVKIMANWFAPRRRGRMSGWLGTSYQVGNALSWLLAGYLVAHVGWRYAFWVPAVILAGVGVVIYLVLRDAPEQVGLPSIEAENGLREVAEDEPAYAGLRYTLSKSLAHPRIWLVGISFMAFQLVRYGMVVWAPTYLFETRGGSIAAIAVTVAALPLAGSVGSVLSGWATDRFLGSRRAPVIVVQLVLLAGLVWVLPRISPEQFGLSLALLMLIGAATYGPDVLMAGTIPMDVATRRAAGSAAGLIDALGYVGASVTAIGSGFIAEHYGWTSVFYLWAGGALAAALLMSAMWNYRPPREDYL